MDIVIKMVTAVRGDMKVWNKGQGGKEEVLVYIPVWKRICHQMRSLPSRIPPWLCRVGAVPRRRATSGYMFPLLCAGDNCLKGLALVQLERRAIQGKVSRSKGSEIGSTSPEPEDR